MTRRFFWAGRGCFYIVPHLAVHLIINKKPVNVSKVRITSPWGILSNSLSLYIDTLEYLIIKNKQINNPVGTPGGQGGIKYKSMHISKVAGKPYSTKITEQNTV